MAVTVNKEECCGCGTCVDACPVSALEVTDGVVSVNEAECLECGACVDECPLGCLSL